MSNCPHCGQQVELTASGRRSWRLGTGRGNWSTVKMRPYHSAPFGQDAPPFAEFAEAVRQEPVARPTIESDLIVPFGIAIISGALGALICWRLRLADPVVSGLVIMGAVWAVAVIAGRRLLWLTERVTGKDLNADRHIGEPVEWRIAVSEKDSEGQVKKMRFLYPPPGVTQEQFTEYMRAVLSGGGMGYDRWTGKDGAFSRKQYDGVLKELRRLGLCRNYGGSRGHELTAKGQATFRGLLLSRG